MAIRVPFKGGPLHGRVFEFERRRPMYLTDEGAAMSAKAGDRIFSYRGESRRDVRYRTGYIFRTNPSDRNGRYVHSSLAEDMLA